VSHGHFTVNGRKVNTPSYRLRTGDQIEVKDSSKNLFPIVAAIESNASGQVPAWLEVDDAKRLGRVAHDPFRQEIDTEVDETLNL